MRLEVANCVPSLYQTVKNAKIGDQKLNALNVLMDMKLMTRVNAS